MIIAVDFDNTLAITDYPKIIEPITPIINYCKEQKSLGNILILYTCRHGQPLTEAVEFCREQGLTFDYINANTPANIAYFGDSRKVYADVYIDDHNIKLEDIVNA